MSENRLKGKTFDYKDTRGITITGKIGFSFLGISFLLWALVSSGYIFNGISSDFLNTDSGTVLGLASIILTVGGLAASGFNLPHLTRSGRSALITSMLLFAALQLAGLYFILDTFFDGINIGYGPDTYFIYLAVFSTVFLLYLVIYVLFLIPFLNRNGRRLMIVGSVISVFYLALLLIWSSRLDFSPTAPSLTVHAVLPGAILPVTIQLFAPFFGFPAYVIGTDMLYTQPAWAMALPLVSDIIFAVLCFSIAGSKGSGFSH
jgi:hypothetical protein